MAKSIISSVKSGMSDFKNNDLFKDVSAQFDSDNPNAFLTTFKVLFMNAVNMTNPSRELKERYEKAVNAWTMDNIKTGIHEGWLKEDY